jgi:heat shock protein HslJ
MSSLFPLPFAILLLSLFLPAQEGASQVKPGDPLDGTAWELFAYRRTKPPEWMHFRVSFTEGALTGFGGCNEFAGSYRVSGTDFEILDVEWVDHRQCVEPEGIMEEESFLFIFLQAGRRFRIEDADEKRLLIFRPDGEALTFEPIG